MVKGVMATMLPGVVNGVTTLCLWCHGRGQYAEE
jgi:hypothetical protein